MGTTRATSADAELADAIVHCLQVGVWGGVLKLSPDRIHKWLSELRDLRRERDRLAREVKGLRRDVAPPGTLVKRKVQTRRQAAAGRKR